MLNRLEDAALKHCRLEALNHMGYIASTIIVVAIDRSDKDAANRNFSLMKRFFFPYLDLIEGDEMAKVDSKLDVLDLLIDIFQDHESSLYEIVQRFEEISLDMEKRVFENLSNKIDDQSQKLYEIKIRELESKIESYKRILLKLLGHCDKINDKVCISIIARDSVKK